MLEAVFIPFITIALAELGDKSQLSLFLLASRIKNHLSLFFGAIAAFLIVDGIAVFLGEGISRLIPADIMQAAASCLFIAVGAWIILNRKKNNDQPKACSYGPFCSGFALIFFTEWGDKTQIAALLFAAKYNGALVLCGVLLALSVLSAAAIFAGSRLNRKIDPRLLNIGAGIIFILLGILGLVR